MVGLHPDLVDKEFWYSDVTLVNTKLPGGFDRDDVDLSGNVTKDIKLKVPLVSSPMDTVTNGDMAILMALMGGIGVIHYNYPTVNGQIDEAEKLKRFEAAFIRNPLTLGAQSTVGDVYEHARKHGFFSYPITEDGTPNSPMVGIVTRRDVRYVEDMSIPVTKVMTPRERLRVAHKRETLDRNDIKVANSMIREYNLDTLPIVDDDFHPVALVTDSDLRKNEQYRDATKNDNKQLMGLVAIEGMWNDPHTQKLIKERVHGAHDVGVEGVVIDQGILYTDQIDVARYVKDTFPDMQVVAGNVDSAEMVRAVMKEASTFIDALRYGVAVGDVCTTFDLGLGRAPGYGLHECAQMLDKLKEEYGEMPLIADGGFNTAGDIIHGFALGARSVMSGVIFAALAESPALMRYNEEIGRLEKLYRGMGSIEAIQLRSSDRYGMKPNTKIRIPEGTSKWLGYRGSGHEFVPFLVASLKQVLHKLGYRNIGELQQEGYLVPLRRK